MIPRVLVIDDDKMTRMYMAEGLRTAGYTVREADGAMTGIDLCEQHEFDIVVTDIVMPHREGTSLIVELLRRYPKVKVLAVSGAQPSPFLDHLEMAKRVGAHRTLRKPFTVEVLCENVRLLVADAVAAKQKSAG